MERRARPRTEDTGDQLPQGIREKVAPERLPSHIDARAREAHGICAKKARALVKTKAYAKKVTKEARAHSAGKMPPPVSGRQ